VSETTTFDDLELLDGGDLQAVLEQLSSDEIVAALAGCNPGLCSRLLRKLGQRYARTLAQSITAAPQFSFEQVHLAQQKAIFVMCTLSRAGQIAFDLPEDMAA
jgi:flagellar motor switch protein FliG